MIITTINGDKIKFMKAKAQQELTAVRLLLAEIQNEEIKTKKKLTDDDIFVIIKKLTKQIGETKDYAIQMNDAVKIIQYQTQLDTLNQYLPKQLTQDEIKAIVQKVIDETGATAKTIGLVLKNIMPLVKGKADGKVVNAIVKEMLS